MSVIEPSNAVKCRNDKQTEGRRLALRASLRPPVSTLNWLGLVPVSLPTYITHEDGKASVPKCRYIKFRRRGITKMKNIT